MKRLMLLGFLIFYIGYTIAQQTIDLHSHNILSEYLMVLDKHNAAWEETFPLPSWNVEDHLRFMEEAGISLSVLSMPAPHPYYEDRKECQEIIRLYNEKCAQLKEAYPNKFAFCASLPLPDINTAVREAIYALDTLKADGIKLATNSRGLYVGDARLDTLMDVLDKRNAVIILHPHKPTPVNDRIIHSTPLPVYEYPAETTRAIINLITRNVLIRYPNIKVVVPHCGSFLPLAIPRMRALYPTMQKNRLMENIDWEGNLSRLYYDLAGATSIDVIRVMLLITTPDHLLYGSDYPYQPSATLNNNLRRLKETIEKDDLLYPWIDSIMHGNAEKLLQIQK